MATLTIWTCIKFHEDSGMHANLPCKLWWRVKGNKTFLLAYSPKYQIVPIFWFFDFWYSHFLDKNYPFEQHTYAAELGLHSTCPLTKVFGKFVLLNVVGYQLLSCRDVDPHIARVLDGGRGYSNVHLQTEGKYQLLGYN